MKFDATSLLRSKVTFLASRVHDDVTQFLDSQFQQTIQRFLFKLPIDCGLVNFSQTSSMATTVGRVLIYGGKGALGSACVTYFKGKQYWVGSIDLAPNEMADANILVKPEASWTDQEAHVLGEVETLMGGTKLDAVFCVAGGWAGGSAAAKAFIKNADMMWKQSVWTSSISAAISAKHLKEGGVLTLPGAMPALEGTPGMIGYGMAKAAIHQLVKSLACDKSGMPANSLTVGILPMTLDTPMNRKFMSEADFTTWTPLEFVAELFNKWMCGADRPANGSLMKLITKDSITDVIAA